MEVAEKNRAGHTRPIVNEQDQQPHAHSPNRSTAAKVRHYFQVVDVRGEIPELDGLRAIAILLVLARHGVRPFYTPEDGLFSLGGAWDFATPLLNGWAGVDLFFVLSGFLITYHLLRRWPAKFDGAFLYRYWLKRTCRIVPAYYAMLAIVCLGLIPYYTPPNPNLAATLPAHLIFMQDYFGSDIVVVFWSLGVEEKFYLIAPFVLLLTLRLSKPTLRYLFLALLALLPLGLRLLTYQLGPLILTYSEFFWTLRSPFHLILDGFWMGAICAILYHDRPRVLTENIKISKYVLYIGLTIIFSLLFPRPLLSSNDWLYGVVTLFLFPLGFAAILLAVVFQPQIAGVLRVHVFAFLSKLSYSLYLVHLALIPFVLAILNATLPLDDYPSSIQFLLFFPVYIAISIVGALALHFVVEKPFLLLKDRIRM